MTQSKNNVKRIAELNSLFLTLDEKGQDSALIILKSLDFAQTVMYSEQKIKEVGEKEYECIAGN